MRRFLTPRVLAAAVVFVAIGGTLAAVYLTILAPQIQARRRIQRDLNEAQENFVRVKTNFGQNPDPQAELTLLTKEVASLETAVASLQKISRAKLPPRLYPEDLATEDKVLLARRYKDHLEDTAEAVSDRVEDAYRAKRVALDSQVNFEESLKVTGNLERDEIQKRSNEAMIDVLVMEDIAMLLLDADILALRDLKPKKQTRSGELILVETEVKAELSTGSLVRLLYLMREQEAYYFFDDVELEPVTRSRGSTYFDTSDSAFAQMDEQRLTADLMTVRSQASGPKVDIREQARERAEQVAKARESAEASPWMRLMKELDDPEADKKKFGEDKPWWKFW